MKLRSTRALVVALAGALLALLPVAGASAEPGQVDAAVAAEVGYHLVTADGDVLVYGTADDDGDVTAIPLNGEVVDGAGTATGDGYWLAAEDGGVFALGDARFHGSAGALPLNQPVVGMSSTPSGQGYWLVASDGGVFSYGDAVFYGSTGSLTLNSPVTDIEPTPTGEGYWLVAEDGGIFSFGDAVFHGSLGGSAISSPVVAMAANADGSGYWLVRADGTIDEFGGASALPDLSGIALSEPVVAAVRTITGNGLWLTTREGGVYAVGDATVVGSNKGSNVGGAQFQAAVDLDEPVVGIFSEASGDFELTILHNNDGESQLENGGGGFTEFGGIAHFATLVEQLRDQVFPGNAEGGILLSSGDNFLAGTEIQASFEKGVPWYDSIALRRIGYDAFAIGNHEFDFGPASLADFIQGFGGTVPFLSSNLDFSGEPVLQALVSSGDIAASTVVMVNGRRVGVVGATTPLLPTISSPGAVTVDSDVAGAIQAEVDDLTDDGVEIIIVISHLQNVDEDRALVGELSNVDVVIAGGGDELLANSDDLLVDGQVADPSLPYPIVEEDSDGNDVPVVTTNGNYLYVGRLVVTFDKDGALESIEDASGPVRVANADQPDAVDADPFIQANVVDPVVAFQAGLASTNVATVQVLFENQRGTTFGSPPAGKRVQETNLGNLISDAFIWQAEKTLAENPGSFPGISTGQPLIGLENGGGIREDVVFGTLPSWQITLQDTFDILPFGNVLAVVDDVTPAELKAVLESAYDTLPASEGGFLQVGNLIVEVDFGNAVGSRVQELTVDTAGTPIDLVTAGSIVAPPGTLIDIATNNFTAGGGDDLPFPTDDTTTLGLTDQQTLANYLEDPTGLNGTVTAADYPEVAVGGGARILITP